MDGHWHCSRTRLAWPQTFARCCPGVRLVPASDVRFVCQLYADDVAILAEPAEDLQRGLDVVTSWGRKWRFTFCVSPEKSAVMIFGPSRRTPFFTPSNLELPVVRAFRYLGVHFDAFALPHQPSHHSLRLFAQSTTWSRSEGLPVSFGRFLMSTYVLPSLAFGLEFAGETHSSLSVFDRSLRRWGRHLLRWPAGTPNASVLTQ